MTAEGVKSEEEKAAEARRGPQVRGPGGHMPIGAPVQKSRQFGPSAKRLLRLMGPERRKALTHERRLEFVALRRSSLKVGRAWAMKEAARQLWAYTTRGWAIRGWKAWIGWAQRSQLEPMKKAARMITTHLNGIVNAVRPVGTS